ncbi:MAG TPA: MATE family efflux transporter [Steroidobacteraceae bacterium]|nr:MATE family efflux transporter [Steroidobacteraceae bacterium]
MRPAFNPHAPTWKVFLMFLVPMMLANILQSLSGTINNIFLGQMIGVQALAAASSFFPVMFFLMSFVMGLGSGSSVLIGQAWGAKQPERVRAVAGTTLTVGLLGGLVIALFGGTFAHLMLERLHTPPDIMAEATHYARICLFAMPGFFAFLLLTSIMRGVGDTVTPLFALIVSTIVGLIVTPALINGWMGLPRLGVASAAVGFVASFLVTLVWLGFYMRIKGHALAPNAELMKHMRIDVAILKSVLRIGVPTALQMVVMSLAEIVLLRFVNGFGSHATAAYGVGNQVLGYVQFPAMSIAIAASILGAQAIGGGHTEKLGSITRSGILINFAFTGSLLLICYVFARPLVGLFTQSPEATHIALNLLYIVLWSTLIFGCSAVTSGVMRSSGTVMIPTLLSISAILLVEVPTAWLLSQKLGYGVNGVWMAYPVTFITMLILQGSYYRLFWRKRKIQRLV